MSSVIFVCLSVCLFRRWGTQCDHRGLPLLYYMHQFKLVHLGQLPFQYLWLIHTSILLFRCHRSFNDTLVSVVRSSSIYSWTLFIWIFDEANLHGYYFIYFIYFIVIIQNFEIKKVLHSVVSGENYWLNRRIRLKYILRESSENVTRTHFWV